MRTLWLVIGIVAPPTIVTIFLYYRLAAFRRDRRSRGFFGQPYESLIDVFDRENYTDPGQRLLPWFSVSFALMVAACVIAAPVIGRAVIR